MATQNSRWNNITNKAKQLFQAQQEEPSTLNSLTAEPSTDCSGLPREDYVREFWVLPQAVEQEDYTAIADQAFAEKRTIGFSYDDAGIGALENKTAVLYGIPHAEKQTFLDWYAEYYPCVDVVFRELPSQHVSDLGLHASADPGDLHGGEAEFREFKVLQPGVIKVLSAHSEASIKRLALEDTRSHETGHIWGVRPCQGSQPPLQLIPRAFLSLCKVCV